MRWPWRKKLPPASYDPPGREALKKWAAHPEQRTLDYRAVFDGEVGQRVLYDLLHTVCGIGSTPRAAEPDPNGVLLSGNVGRQEVGHEILTILTLPLGEVIETNRRIFR